MIEFFLSLTQVQAAPSGKQISSQTELNNLQINEGDNISFKRGETFENVNLSITTNNVTFDAYGTGADPILYGSLTHSTWADQGGGVYKGTASSTPQWVYVNGNQIKIARSDYKPVLSSSSNTFTADASYFNTFTNLVGAKIRVFEFQFRMSFEYTITDYSAGTFTIDRDLIIAGNNYYFFVYNYSEFLEDNTFYLDGNDIYIQLPSDPSNYTIQYGVADETFNITGDNCTIQNLDIRHSQRAAVKCYNKTVNVSNCTIYEHRGNGLYMYGQNCIPTLQNNTIYNIGNNGIRIGSAKNGTVSGNTIHDISVLPSPGFPQTDALLSIGKPIDNNHGTTDDTTKVTGNAIILDFDYLESPRTTPLNMTISQNTCYSLGYGGVKLIGDNHTIEKNIIYDYSRIYSDTAAIGTFEGNATYPGYTCSGVTIDRNIIRDFNGQDSPYNTFPTSKTAGIYLDLATNNCTVTYNTVYKIDQSQQNEGIFFWDQVNTITIQNNTFYYDVIGFKSNRATATTITFTNNLLVSHSASRQLMQARSETFTSCDNNVYIAPYRDNNFIWNETTYNFSDWKTNSGEDANSTEYADYIATTPDPDNEIYIDINETATVKNGSAPAGTWKDKTGATVTSYSIDPYESLMLFKNLP